MRRLYFITLFISLHLIVSAQQNNTTNKTDSFFVIDSAIQIHDLRPATFVFADETNKLTMQDASSGKFDNKFSAFKFLQNI